MPDVRLSGDFKGRKAGEIVELTNDLLSEALGAHAVKKVYREPFPGLERAEARRGLYGPGRDEKTAQAKKSAPSKSDRPAFGDGKPSMPAE